MITKHLSLRSMYESNLEMKFFLHSFSGALIRVFTSQKEEEKSKAQRNEFYAEMLSFCCLLKGDS